MITLSQPRDIGTLNGSSRADALLASAEAVATGAPLPASRTGQRDAAFEVQEAQEAARKKPAADVAAPAKLPGCGSFHCVSPMLGKCKMVITEKKSYIQALDTSGVWKSKWNRTGPKHHLETRMAFNKIQDPLVSDDVLADLQKYVKSGHITVADDFETTGTVQFASGSGTDNDDAADADGGQDSAFIHDHEYYLFKRDYFERSLEAPDYD